MIADRPGGAPGAAQLVALAALYYAGAKLGMVTVLPEGMAVFWPPNAIVLAILLRGDGARLPWILAVVLATEVAADVPAFTVLEALCFGAINFGEAALAYLLLHRMRFDPRFGRPADLWKLVRAVAAASLASALLGAAVYSAFRGGQATYLHFATTWWLGDAIGLLVVTPLALAFPPFGFAPLLPARRPDWRDGLAWASAIAVVALFWIVPPSENVPTQLAPTLLVPGVLYAAARHSLRWASGAVFAASLLVVFSLVQDRDPFGPLPPRLEVLQAQEFILLMALLGLGFSALLTQLRMQNAALEATVEERTAELRHANRLLEHQASTDAVSGAASRRRFDEALEAEVERSRRYGRPVALILADIDHFKRVNDTHGHAAGDGVIRAFAQVLAGNVRRSDLVARFGGEEFAVLMPETTAAQAVEYAERARRELEGLSLAPLDWPLTASFGAAELGEGEGPAELLRAADRALYDAKQAGRNRVRARPKE